MADTFNPFALPSSFDPLDSHAPPPPRRRRGMAADAVARPDKEEAGASGRLAHLLPPAAAGRQGVAAAGAGSAGPSAPAQRLADLEDAVAIQQARLDALEATLTARLDAQGERILQAVATLINERIGQRG